MRVARIQCSEVQNCECTDDDASLIESIRTEMGPHGLTSLCHHKSMHYVGEVMSSINALEENNGSLKLLVIRIRSVGLPRSGGLADEIIRALAAALRKNNGLIELGIRFEPSARWVQGCRLYPLIQPFASSTFLSLLVTNQCEHKLLRLYCG